jgi:hypothetical protein
MATLADRGTAVVPAVFDDQGELVDQHEVGSHVETVAIVGPPATAWCCAGASR